MKAMAALLAVLLAAGAGGSASAQAPPGTSLVDIGNWRVMFDHISSGARRCTAWVALPDDVYLFFSSIHRNPGRHLVIRRSDANVGGSSVSLVKLAVDTGFTLDLPIAPASPAATYKVDDESWGRPLLAALEAGRSLTMTFPDGREFRSSLFGAHRALAAYERCRDQWIRSEPVDPFDVRAPLEKVDPFEEISARCSDPEVMAKGLPCRQ